MSDKPRFICPDCQGTRIEEIMVGVTVAIVVTAIESNGELDYDGWPESHGGTVDRYQCVNCGWMIPNATCGEELLAFLDWQGK